MRCWKMQTGLFYLVLSVEQISSRDLMNLYIRKFAMISKRNPMKLNRKAPLVVFMEAAVCCWEKNCQNFGLLFKNSDLIISSYFL